MEQLQAFRPSSLTSVIASLAHLGHHPGAAWALEVLSALSPSLEATARLAGQTAIVTDENSGLDPDLDAETVPRDDEAQAGASESGRPVDRSGLADLRDVDTKGESLPGTRTSSDPGGVVTDLRKVSKSPSPASTSSSSEACDAIAMSQLVWGLGRLGHRHHLDVHWARRLLVPALAARLPEMNAQGVANSLWGELGMRHGGKFCSFRGSSLLAMGTSS